MDENYLVEQLAALGHVTRLGVVRQLLAAPGGLPAGRIANSLGVRQNSLSPHLASLARSNLISGTRDGREVIYVAREENLGRLAQQMHSLLAPASGK